jgi:hypothetical protein
MVPTNPLSDNGSGSGLKWIIILIFLGGMGYLIYWYFVIKKKN